MFDPNYLLSKTIIVVPCFNAEKTILNTVNDIKSVGYTNILICDDASTDNTVEIVKTIENIHLIEHSQNKGYGGNQKTLYNEALKLNYDFVIMVHGDHQYDPLSIPSLSWLLYAASYDVVMGSRILGGHPLKNGMPVYKYISNRILTYFQNIITGYKLSEYHSGLRAYKTTTLRAIDFNHFSDSFIFDNQLILKCMKLKLKFGEITCQTKFNHLTSSISFKNSILYGLGIIKYSILYVLKK
jgi:glycosyltransferase involved in cell wall biosynthesis